MKTNYSTPDITIIQVSSVVLQQTSVDTNSYIEGNAQEVAATRKVFDIWEDADGEE